MLRRHAHRCAIALPLTLTAVRGMCLRGTSTSSFAAGSSPIAPSPLVFCRRELHTTSMHLCASQPAAEVPQSGEKLSLHPKAVEAARKQAAEFASTFTPEESTQDKKTDGSKKSTGGDDNGKPDTSGDQSSEQSFQGKRFVQSVLNNWQRGLFTAVGACCGIGGLLFLLWTPMKHDTVQHTAKVASEALTDVKLKEQAVLLSKQVVENILKDENSVTLLCQVIRRLLADPDSRIAVTMFIQGIFEDAYTKEITKKFVIDIIQDEWVREQLNGIAQNLALDLLQDPKTQDIMATFLLTTAIDALRDGKLHAEGGKAVRNTAYHVINPWAKAPAQPISPPETPAPAQAPPQPQAPAQTQAATQDPAQPPAAPSEENSSIPPKS